MVSGFVLYYQQPNGRDSSSCDTRTHPNAHSHTRAHIHHARTYMHVGTHTRTEFVSDISYSDHTNNVYDGGLHLRQWKKSKHQVIDM
jgi:hypothetical protein